MERGLPRGDVSLYRHYRHLVVSIDFVKSDRNRQRFLDNAPDFVIVDEAHTAARPRGDRSGAQHQRFALLRDIAKDPKRHMVLATATPHSGIEESFRSLPLGFLDHHVKCGDSLVGVSDLTVLTNGIPDDAYKPVTGDDKEAAKLYRQRNKLERAGQQR